MRCRTSGPADYCIMGRSPTVASMVRAMRDFPQLGHLDTSTCAAATLRSFRTWSYMVVAGVRGYPGTLPRSLNRIDKAAFFDQKAVKRRRLRRITDIYIEVAFSETYGFSGFPAGSLPPIFSESALAVAFGSFSSRSFAILENSDLPCSLITRSYCSRAWG